MAGWHFATSIITLKRQYTPRRQRKRPESAMYKQSAAAVKKLTKGDPLLTINNKPRALFVDVSFINVSILKEEQCHPKAAHSRLH